MRHTEKHLNNSPSDPSQSPGSQYSQDGDPARAASEHDSLYPRPTRELDERRSRLAPQAALAFHAFSKSVFADGAIPSKTKQLIAVAVA
ncbi:MAG: hypothetical protein ACREPM_23630, partial [Gemmatimonadaceae bacterium]